MKLGKVLVLGLVATGAVVAYRKRKKIVAFAKKVANAAKKAAKEVNEK